MTTDTEVRLAGKVALVTGGSRGLGAQIVRRLAADGADVALTYNTGKDGADRVAGQVRELGRRALVIRADLAEAPAAAAVLDAAIAEFGKVDILVNNAGALHWFPLRESTLEDVDLLLAVNARAPFLLVQAAADKLAEGGRIVNLSSAAISTAMPNTALYGGSKAFVEQLTRVAALELGARRITVNAVGPGTSATESWEQIPAERRAQLEGMFALGRVGRPADTANLVSFLVGDEADFITGQVIYNTGGQNAFGVGRV
ncbi:MAG TPA: SDR family oxidoreductase [Actinocrinis sp.]|jgi:NAD(P)-dependent dehydrogenase (short-subunit alcohol dehydrogenase family)